jgi:hypothetical protein
LPPGHTPMHMAHVVTYINTDTHVCIHAHTNITLVHT